MPALICGDDRGSITIPACIVDRVLSNVMANYAEQGRVYHTFGHARLVMDRCALAHGQIGLRHPLEVALAGLYHDVIYNPLAPRGENEIASASRAIANLDQFSRLLDNNSLILISGLIKMTADHGNLDGTRLTVDEQVFLDSDLLGLAGDMTRFDIDNFGIEQEYTAAGVDEGDFLKGRREFLHHLYRAERIFFSAFYSGFESAARENLRREMQRVDNRLRSL